MVAPVDPVVKSVVISVVTSETIFYWFMGNQEKICQQIYEPSSDAFILTTIPVVGNDVCSVVSSGATVVSSVVTSIDILVLTTFRKKKQI